MRITAQTYPNSIINGVSQLYVESKLTNLSKYPHWNLTNVHEETIDHHFRYTDHTKHDIDLTLLDKTKHIAKQPYTPGFSKEKLKFPLIRCPFCNYTDKIEFDLSLHMLEKHKLIQIPISSQDRKRIKGLSGDFFARFEPAIEFRLNVAVEMTKKENRNLGVKYAIRQIQKRIPRRQQEKERASDEQETLEANQGKTEFSS